MDKRASKDLLLGHGAVIITAILWSTSGLFIKLLIDIDWHPIHITSARSLISSIFLLICRQFIKTPEKPRFFAKNRGILPLWSGGIAYAITMLGFVYANSLTTAANAIILQYTAPVWAAFLGWYFNREKPHWEHWGAILLVSFGLLLFFRDGLVSGAIIGDGIAVFSGLAFGATTVFMRMMKDGNPADCMLLAHVLCAIFGIPFFLLNPPLLSVSAILPLMYMGIIQVGLASLFYAYAIKKISAVQAMLTAIIEPILNPVWVMFFTGERPANTALVGGAIIIIAVAASSVIGMKRNGK